jgi:Cdc6-like AAA superfamily ATPase
MHGLLSGSRQQVLYHLFSWTQRRRSKLVLFGIANSIDLTDRFLPRLKQRECEPELLIFRPYTKGQLVDILRARLFSDGDGQSLFEDIAVTLCAQKVAKMYGDVRKCLELSRNALSVLLTEHRHDKEAKVGFIAMKEVLSASFQSPLIGIIRDLPNHQKTILVVALLLVGRPQEDGDRRSRRYSKLEAFYQFMAKKHILPKTSAREFNVVIDSLVTDNIVKVVANHNALKSKSKAAANAKKSKKTLSNDSRLDVMVSRDDLLFAFKDEPTLSKFFEMNIVVPPRFRNQN